TPELDGRPQTKLPVGLRPKGSCPTNWNVGCGLSEKVFRNVEGRTSLQHECPSAGNEMRQLLRIFYIGIAWLLVSSAAFAACVEDRRPLVVGDNVVQLRAYTCGLGDQPDGPQVRVEIHRLSDVAASIILAKQSSEVLARVIGSATLIGNEVAKVYTDPLRQFGETVGGVLGTTTVEAGGSGGRGSIFDRKRQDPFRVLGAPGVYPAMEEIDALRRKIIPPGLKYFYAIDCFDDRSNVDTGVCQKYNSKPEMHFWRNMRPDDIAN